MKKILIFCFILIVYPTVATSETLYDILGLEPSCPQKDIKPAYNRMMMAYHAFHPDYNKSPDVILQSQKINEAYEILSDPEKRAMYDRGEMHLQGANRTNKQSTTEDETEDDQSTAKESEPTDDSSILHNIIEQASHHISGDFKRDHEKYQKQEQEIYQKVSVFLEEEIDPDVITAFFVLSIQKRLISVAHLFLEKGAKPEIPNKNRNNGLHLLIINSSFWLDKVLDERLGIRHRLTRREHYDYSKLANKNADNVLALAKAIIKKAQGTNLLTARNKQGNDPLHTTLIHGSPRLVKLITEAIEQQEELFDWNAQNNSQETYYALAIKNRHPKMAHLFLEKGAKPEIPNKNRNNGLHLIALRMTPYEHYPEIQYNTKKNKAVVLDLVRDTIKAAEGTNLLTARNNENKLPLQIAMDNFPELAELIIEMGGDRGLTEEERNLLIKKALEEKSFQIVRLLRRGNTMEETSPSLQLTITETPPRISFIQRCREAVGLVERTGP